MPFLLGDGGNLKTLMLYVFAKHIWGKEYCVPVRTLKEMVMGGGTTGENQREMGKKLKFGDEMSTRGEKPDGVNFGLFKAMVDNTDRVSRAVGGGRTDVQDIGHMVISCNNYNVLDIIAPNPKKDRRKMFVLRPSNNYAEGGKIPKAMRDAMVNSILEVIDPANAEHLKTPAMEERRKKCVANHPQVVKVNK